MNQDNLEKVATRDGDAIRTSSIGYAINLMMDYGSGRQVTISGTLPLGATLEQFNAELDKLRLATNRQSSLVVLRDIENTVAMGKKTIACLELMIAESDKGFEAEMERLKQGTNANHNQTKQTIENIRTQATQTKMTKNEELMRARSDVEKGELVIARIKKEIGEG